jgi:hypothetical protein
MNFYNRLKDYYESVAKVLRGEAEAAAIFPNPTDKGISREQIYAEFLRQHAPSKCNVFFGGFVFAEDGSESGQLDVLITADSTPRFNFHNKDGNGKSFSPVEGTLAVASIKSTLDKKELEDSLKAISRIPPTEPLGKRLNPMLKFNDYEDWPYKIVYASSGIDGNTLLAHIKNYYMQNPTIPISRRPNIIHVSGKYAIFRFKGGMNLLDNDNKIKIGEFLLINKNSDLQSIVWTLDAIQKYATISTHILYSYDNLINKVVESVLQGH